MDLPYVPGPCLSHPAHASASSCPDPRRDVRPRGALRSRAVPPPVARRRSAPPTSWHRSTRAAPARARRDRRVAARARSFPSPPRPRCTPARSRSDDVRRRGHGPSGARANSPHRGRRHRRPRRVRASVACSPGRRPARSRVSSVASSRSDRQWWVVLTTPRPAIAIQPKSATRSGGASRSDRGSHSRCRSPRSGAPTTASSPPRPASIVAIADIENVEVTSSHLGMGFDPDVWRVVARRLALDGDGPQR